MQCVAVSDLYDDRLTATREYLNKDVPTFRDYRSILDRKDIDAVIIAAISCHMANHSYFKNAAAVWDAQAHRIRT